MGILRGLFLENVHFVKGLAPSADVYDTNPDSTIVNASNFEKIVFLLHQKTGGTNTGTANVKVKAAVDAGGTSPENIVFKYAKMTTGASDVMSAVTEAVAASGFGTTANENTAYVVEVDVSDLPPTKPYVFLDLTETVNDPVLGSCMIFGVNPKKGYPFATALT